MPTTCFDCHRLCINLLVCVSPYPRGNLFRILSKLFESVRNNEQQMNRFNSIENNTTQTTRTYASIAVTNLRVANTHAHFIDEFEVCG